MNILVTGGAGYIGSFMVKTLLEKGFGVTVIDSLERGSKEAVDQRAKLVIGNLLDKKFLSSFLSEKKFEAIIHFAGYISMEESMENPSLYFENNVFGALNLLSGMQKNKINNFIFSSTAGVYGNPIRLPMAENHPRNPTNPYGESKLMVERILSWFQEIHGLSFASLRYFNACGAALDGSLGENHQPETHIIPNALISALTNSEFILYGKDYQTPDKTCIRDYIHVIDLVEAHLLVLEKISEKKGGYFYNVGTGKGYSNKEVIAMVKKVTGIDFKVKTGTRRPGDADVLIADPSRINQELGFVPKYSDLKTIVKTAWQWHRKLKIKDEK